jgi:hypothetical protein
MAEQPALAEAGKLIELIAPGGCDEANHGMVRYRVGNDGRIRVPREAAYWLIKKAGFVPAPATPREPDRGGEEAPRVPRRTPPRGATIEE